VSIHTHRKHHDNGIRAVGRFPTHRRRDVSDGHGARQRLYGLSSSRPIRLLTTCRGSRQPRSFIPLAGLSCHQRPAAVPLQAARPSVAVTQPRRELPLSAAWRRLGRGEIRCPGCRPHRFHQSSLGHASHNVPELLPVVSHSRLRPFANQRSDGAVARVQEVFASGARSV
jgi:hypothetical protein